MPKDHRLPERPKPPSIDQIMSDIKCAGDDDVVFSGNSVTISRDSTPVNENMSPLHKIEENGQSDDSSTAKSKSPDIGETYLKTLDLLDLVEQLKNIPDELKEQYEQLEKLGAEVADVINELKESANTVKHKTKT